MQQDLGKTEIPRTTVKHLQAGYSSLQHVPAKPWYHLHLGTQRHRWVAWSVVTLFSWSITAPAAVTLINHLPPWLESMRPG